jgi:hypothetical protein
MSETKKFYREKIVSNKVKCLQCGDTIESTHGHDFCTCTCGGVSVDGGKRYLRRSFKEHGTWEDISETYQEEREPWEWEIEDKTDGR